MGFDHIVVDNQHGRWDDESTMRAFRSIALGPAAPMARVRQNDYGAIGRLLDIGAMGVIVPMVNSAAEAEAAAYATRYPPRWGRSGVRLGLASWAQTMSNGQMTKSSSRYRSRRSRPWSMPRRSWACKEWTAAG